ncbi:hypothetical protein BTO20_20340 [Mycobacterium dioxanotrophicus]|uniref:Uncharacterized protein n=1 Tax=Mycobacterium dioxanotrophicus TaxID=482462 RepID=A0A1Y0C656_9MYCO|nr:hypothetical protein [Mycobacterium dioxanotrophicus]ART70577.1 hypothetical protein BTO20_20340 [Mycobacterium dioxanotrophicus]
MTQVEPLIVGGIPLVRLSGTVTERSGAELASKVMGAIFYSSHEVRPLSLQQPRLADKTPP